MGKEMGVVFSLVGFKPMKTISQILKKIKKIRRFDPEFVHKTYQDDNRKNLITIGNSICTRIKLSRYFPIEHSIGNFPKIKGKWESKSRKI